MKIKALCLVVILVCSLASFFLAFGGKKGDVQSVLIRNIPPRPAAGVSGSEFARSIYGLQGTQREQLIVEQLKAGNLPDFLRRLVPVHLSRTSGDGRPRSVTLFVMPDYLSIGSNRDFIRIPMGLHAAAAIADQFGFILPTRKIVDAIFSQSAFTLKPEPLPAGARMTSTAYYLTHNKMVRDQRLALGCPLGELISGHKKDVVLTNLLAGKAGESRHLWMASSLGRSHSAPQHGPRIALRRLQSWHPPGQRHGPARWATLFDLDDPGRPGACGRAER